ncbi:MAG: metallophosphoesterase [Chloroflexi bacterium]|nr:metallophosphoesterase [Chloroflexota bacterium]
MKNVRNSLTFILAFVLLLAAGGMPTSASPLAKVPIVFAVIGDYGKGSPEEADVATLVKSWNPQFIVTLGDNNYSVGSALEIDAHIGQYYHEFIYPYQGGYGAGADVNRFFPALGNHDWMTDNAQPYLDYFTLPGNERYYAFTRGSASFFMLDSDSHEPDGNDAASKQAAWLRDGLAASNSAFNLVIAHHAPYSSGQHGSALYMQWPFKDWGADAVLSGHDHTYERLNINGLTYFVNGLGGASLYSFNNILPESQARYNADYGAMRVEITATRLLFEFYNRGGQLRDSFTLDKTQTFEAASESFNDGWTREVAEPLNVGGAANSSATVIRLGDDAYDRQYRAILSFDTSSLPDNAVITKVTLRIKKQGQAGADPFATLGALRVDIRKPYFGGSAGLAAGDFQAASGKSGIGAIPNAPVGDWYSKTWTTDTFFSHINRLGATQFRLRFTTDDNDNGSADYLKFFSGNASVASTRPTLIIEYYVP